MLEKNIKIDGESRQPSYRHLTGKIARLPNDIRDELNRRLLDGQPASDILPWLNGLSPVRKILDAKFHGKPIQRQNLDYWRRTGYQFWLQQEQAFLALHRISREARSVTQADCQALARGTATVVASRLFQLVQSSASEKYTLDDYQKITATVKPVLTGEHNVTRLKYEYERFCQRERSLILMRNKHQRDVVAISMRLMHDNALNELKPPPLITPLKSNSLASKSSATSGNPAPFPSRDRLNLPSFQPLNPPHECKRLQGQASAGKRRQAFHHPGSDPDKTCISLNTTSPIAI
jgi:hypothetical protein